MIYGGKIVFICIFIERHCLKEWSGIIYVVGEMTENEGRERTGNLHRLQVLCFYIVEFKRENGTTGICLFNFAQ